MSWLLSLAAQGGWCSVAVRPLDPGCTDRIGECWSELAGVDQSQSLLRLVDGLLASRRIARNELAAIACDAGPGSFTALRISCAVGQGLALGLGLPLVAVGTLDALAVQVAMAQESGRHRVLVASDARMNELYVAEYEVELDPVGESLALRTLRVPCVCSPHALIGMMASEPPPVEPIVLGGDGPLVYPDLVGLMAARGLQLVPGAEPGRALRADVVGLLAQRRFAAGGDFDPAFVAPMYVRDKVALDLGEQQALRATRARSA
jgi:tRNA threonylcarbamoyladenosine biosynthesis protein TsaB